MTTSIPQTNPLASTVLSTLQYRPVASAVGANLANVVPGLFGCIKVGQFVRMYGSVVYDVTGAVTGAVVCDLTLPDFNGLFGAIGSGVTINAVQVGGVAGSGVCSVEWKAGTPNLLELKIDRQAFVGAGYEVRLDVLLIIEDAS